MSVTGPSLSVISDLSRLFYALSEFTSSVSGVDRFSVWFRVWLSAAVPVPCAERVRGPCASACTMSFAPCRCPEPWLSARPVGPVGPGSGTTVGPLSTVGPLLDTTEHCRTCMLSATRCRTAVGLLRASDTLTDHCQPSDCCHCQTTCNRHRVSPVGRQSDSEDTRSLSVGWLV